jgi:Uma2 family endonuclease
MVGAVGQNAPVHSVPSFRTWLESRPDEEHWELIGGVPVMMTPPNRRHQRITSNLEALLNAALKRHDPAWPRITTSGSTSSPPSPTIPSPMSP